MGWLFTHRQPGRRAADGPLPTPARTLRPWAPHHALQLRHTWILDIQGQNGLPDPHIEGASISTQEQSVEILEALLMEEAQSPAAIPCREVMRRGE